MRRAPSSQPLLADPQLAKETKNRHPAAPPSPAVMRKPEQTRKGPSVGAAPHPAPTGLPLVKTSSGRAATAGHTPKRAGAEGNEAETPSDTALTKADKAARKRREKAEKEKVRRQRVAALHDELRSLLPSQGPGRSLEVVDVLEEAVRYIRALRASSEPAVPEADDGEASGGGHSRPSPSKLGHPINASITVLTGVAR